MATDRPVDDRLWARLVERRLAAKWPCTELTDEDIADLEAEARCELDES